jgi:DNA-binding beta-propeller fold protein YncE
VASTRKLAAVRTVMLALPGSPFGVVTTPDGAWSFVSLLSEIAVISDRSPGTTLVRTVALPAGAQALGVALTADGRSLLVASGAGVVVVDALKAEQGGADPVLGVLSSGKTGWAASATEVSVSPDDAYAFVSLEYGDSIAVFDLRAAASVHYTDSGFRGLIPLGHGVVGTAISPDGHWLYATSEVGAGPSAHAGQASGTLSVVDLARAESDPAHAVVATVAAGCQPVRVAVTSQGTVVWVTARGRDALLGFSAAALRGADPDHALVADVPVGEEPVGLALAAHGRRIVVADSDRFHAPGAHPELSLVDPAAALAGRPALLGSITAGDFPREMSLEPDERILLVTNYSSRQLEAIDLGKLP